MSIFFLGFAQVQLFEYSHRKGKHAGVTEHNYIAVPINLNLCTTFSPFWGLCSHFLLCRWKKQSCDGSLMDIYVNSPGSCQKEVLMSPPRRWCFLPVVVSCLLGFVCLFVGRIMQKLQKRFWNFHYLFIFTFSTISPGNNSLILMKNIFV